MGAVTERALTAPPREPMSKQAGGALSYRWFRFFTDIVMQTPKQAAYQVTIDPAPVAAMSTAEQGFMVKGIRLGDIVTAVNKPSYTAGIAIGNVRASGTDTLAITFINITGATINPPPETYLVATRRP